MFIGHLKTRVIEVDNPEGKREGGFMEMPVHVDNKQIGASGAPWPFVSKEIAIHLAQAILDTGMPRELWAFYPSDDAKRAFNLDFDAMPMEV